MLWYFLFFSNVTRQFFRFFFSTYKINNPVKIVALRDGHKHGHLKRNPRMTFTKNRSTCCIHVPILHASLIYKPCQYVCYRSLNWSKISLWINIEIISFQTPSYVLSPSQEKLKQKLTKRCIDYTFISVTATACARLLFDRRCTIGKYRKREKREGTRFKGACVETARTISSLSKSERQQAGNIRRTVAIARECSQGSRNQGVQRGKDLGDLLASSWKRAKGHHRESWRESRVDRDAGK